MTDNSIAFADFSLDDDGGFTQLGDWEHIEPPAPGLKIEALVVNSLYMVLEASNDEGKVAIGIYYHSKDVDGFTIKWVEVE